MSAGDRRALASNDTIAAMKRLTAAVSRSDCAPRDILIVRTSSIARGAQPAGDTTAVKRCIAGVVALGGQARMSPADKAKLHDWLQARVKADSLVVVY